MSEIYRQGEKDMKTILLYALRDIPLIQPGDDVGSIICNVAEKQNFLFQDRDIVVIASKIISKAEGQLIDTDQIKPSKRARLLSEKLGMDPKNLEVILGETKKLLIARPNLLLTENRLGIICTKAGVDSSNTTEGPKGKVVALLPKDPDLSAAKIRKTIKDATEKEIAVVINDTFGRSDRKGSIGMAIGFSGISAIYSPEIKEDIYGKIRNPEVAQVDEISASASLLMGQTNERRPVIILRGLEYKISETDGIKNLLYPSTKYIQDALDVSRQFEK